MVMDISPFKFMEPTMLSPMMSVLVVNGARMAELEGNVCG